MAPRICILVLALLAVVLPASARADDPDGDHPPEEFRMRKEIVSVALGGGVLAGPALPPTGVTAVHARLPLLGRWALAARYAAGSTGDVRVGQSIGTLQKRHGRRDRLFVGVGGGWQEVDRWPSRSTAAPLFVLEAGAEATLLGWRAGVHAEAQQVFDRDASVQVVAGARLTRTFGEWERRRRGVPRWTGGWQDHGPDAPRTPLP